MLANRSIQTTPSHIDRYPYQDCIFDLASRTLFGDDKPPFRNPSLAQATNSLCQA
jgi:hypothetical protein